MTRQQDSAAEDIGLATEMAFSGQRREQPEPSYEDDVGLTTEMVTAEDHAEDTRAHDPASVAPDPPQQHFLQHSGSTNEPLAITMLVLLSLVALGTFTLLGLFIYRLFTGA